MSRPTPEVLQVAESARTIALPMMSERGCGAVLAGEARADAALEALLKAALAPPSGPETLFLTDRPLGSFGARIALARRLGLIDRQVELALHTLRSARNAFAHSTAQASLSDACHHQPLAESIPISSQDHSCHPQTIPAIHKPSRAQSSPDLASGRSSRTAGA
jgi:hypothetical protein